MTSSARRESEAARRRVLIVDDSDDDVFLFCRAVRRAQVPWTITGVLANGDEAIRHLEKIAQGKGEARFPEVLFLDIKMPRKNGFEVLAWVGEHLPKGTMKLIVASTSDQPTDLARARELGADEYIVKAGKLMDHVDLLLKIEAALTEGRL